MIDSHGLEFIVCETPEQVKAAQQLRYEVFCLEKGWIDSNECAGDIETDALDEGAVHFLALDQGIPVGTTRYLLGDVCDLPAAQYLRLDQLGVEPREVVEASRLATRKQGRTQDMRLFVGLTTLMWVWAMKRGVKMWLVIADVPFYHMLVRIGLPLIVRGEEVEHLGSQCVPAAFDMAGTGPVLRRRAGLVERTFANT